MLHVRNPDERYMPNMKNLQHSINLQPKSIYNEYQSSATPVKALIL